LLQFIAYRDKKVVGVFVRFSLRRFSQRSDILTLLICKLERQTLPDGTLTLTLRSS
jgi:hypothetical protein